MEESPSNQQYVDPFAIDQERDKWKKRLTYVMVIIVRILVAGIKFLLGMFKAVGSEILRAFKLIP